MSSKATITAVALAAVVIIAAAAVVWTSGHGNDGGNTDQTEDTVTDALGRTVAIPDNLDNGIAALPGHRAVQHVPPHG